MKIYILKPRDNLVPDPWNPWYDCAFGFIIQAENEYIARMFASDDAGSEGGDVWAKHEITSCKELFVEGEMPEIIMKDFAAA